MKLALIEQAHDRGEVLLRCRVEHIVRLSGGGHGVHLALSGVLVDPCLGEDGDESGAMAVAPLLRRAYDGSAARDISPPGRTKASTRSCPGRAG